MFEFADMDRDGMTDMVYFNEANKAIYTLYNRKTSNRASDDSLCIKPPAEGNQKNLMGESNRIFSSQANIKAGADSRNYDINQTLPIFANGLA